MIKSAHLEHGRKHERIALNRHREDTGLNVNACGLAVSLDFSYLVSFISRLIVSSDSIEVKCSYSSRDKPVSIKTVPHLKHDENLLMTSMTTFIKFKAKCFDLEENNVHSLSIMLIINIIKYVSVFRDNAFILDMIKKLNNVYYVYFKPALLDKHFYRPFSN